MALGIAIMINGGGRRDGIWAICLSLCYFTSRFHFLASTSMSGSCLCLWISLSGRDLGFVFVLVGFIEWARSRLLKEESDASSLITSFPFS